MGIALELDSGSTPGAQEIFAGMDGLMGLAVRRAIDWNSGEFVQLIDGKSYFAGQKQVREYLDIISKVRNGFLRKLGAAAPGTSDFSSLEEWQEPIFDLDHRAEGDNQRVLVKYWENARRGKWLAGLAAQKPSEPLPAICIPGGTLAGLPARPA